MSGSRPNRKEWDHCDHLDLGPTDPNGVAICGECHAAVQLRIAGLPLEEYYAQTSTVIAKEGEDVPFSWPGEG